MDDSYGIHNYYQRRPKLFLSVTTSDTLLHAYVHTYIHMPHFLFSCSEVETGHDGSSDTGVPLPNHTLLHHSMFPIRDLAALPIQVIKY